LCDLQDNFFLARDLYVKVAGKGGWPETPCVDLVPSYFSVFAGTNKPTPPSGTISAAFAMDDTTVSLATLKMKTFESGSE